MTTIGDNIKKRREELKMTQEELALKLNYKSKSTINKIELGINDISQSKVLAFADVLHTTPGYLMGFEKDFLTRGIVTAQVARNPDMQELISLYDSTDTIGRKRVLDMARDMARLYPKG